MEIGRLHAAAILPAGQNPGTNWIYWMGPRGGVDVLQTRNTPCPCRDSNPGPPARRLVTIPTALSRFLHTQGYYLQTGTQHLAANGTHLSTNFNFILYNTCIVDIRNTQPTKCTILFILYTVDIRNTQPTKYTLLFLRYLYYNITLNVPTCFEPQRIIIREPNQSNTTQNQISHFYTQLTCCKRVKQLKCRQLFVV